MTTRSIPEIDFSTFPESDGAPMAETVENMYQMIFLIYALRVLLESQGRTRVAVGGNQFLSYNPANGRDPVAPEVYVALDVEPGNRATWKTWIEGKCPDVVVEISSPSTREQDLGVKRDLYARLGAREYYIYDPQQAMEPSLLGYELRAGRMEVLPTLPGSSIVSPSLGAELRQSGIYLRVVDPVTGAFIRVADEERRDRVSAEEKARAMEAQLQIMAARAQAAEEQVAREALARHAVEEQVTRMEAALQTVQDELERQRRPF